MSYATDTPCPNCKKIDEVVYHQYIDYFTCQLCGHDWQL
jgi:Zn ribbon nucleic-acid-binding protein